MLFRRPEGIVPPSVELQIEAVLRDEKLTDQQKEKKIRKIKNKDYWNVIHQKGGKKF